MRREISLTVHVLQEAVRDGMRLGRHVEHDIRSLAYAIEPWSEKRLQSALWRRRSPILDQAQTGSCTGNALAGALGTDSARTRGFDNVDEQLALQLYERATQLDRIPGEYPPDDTGSTGLAVCKAGKQLDYLSGYHHALSLHAALTALQHGPVITGVNWYDSFDEPDSQGRIEITPGAQVRGAHEFLVRGVEVSRKEVYCDNSWGDIWGLQGRFVMTWSTWDRLLSEHGDVTVPARL
jgi:hypothetical protein